MAAKPLTSNAIALTEKKMNMTLDDIIKMSKRSDFKVKKQRVPNKSQKFSNGGSNKGNALKVRRFMDSRSSLRQGFLGQRRSNFQGNQFPLATKAAKKAAATPIHARVLGRNRMVYWHKPSSWELLRGIGGTAWGRQISNFLPPFLNTGLSSLSVSIKSSRLPPRIGAPPAQRRVLGRGFPGKKQAQVVAKQRPQTLDSLFANMKEQRMRALSQRRNSQRTGGFQQQQRGRGRLATIPSN